MAIVKKLVDKMNGSVNFKSEKNIGTVFSVSLPFKLCHNDSPIEENTKNIYIKMVDNYIAYIILYDILRK